MTKSSLRLMALLTGVAFALALATSDRASAVYSNDPAPNPPKQQSAPAEKGSKKTNTKKKKQPPKQTEKKQPAKQAEDKSEQKFVAGYKAALVTIYDRHDYIAGIAELKALGHDENPDVANLIGFSSRKLGRYDDAKTWYERALAADPRHSRTWSYYGMWHAEHGNMLKAREHLAKVESICGTVCKDYVELKGVIDGTHVY